MSVVTAWLLTYLVQSTLLLGAAWIVSRVLHRRSTVVETVWRVTLLGSIVMPLLTTAGVVRPLTGIITIGDFATSTKANAPEVAAGKMTPGRTSEGRDRDPRAAITAPEATSDVASSAPAGPQTPSDSGKGDLIAPSPPGRGAAARQWTLALVAAWSVAACTLVVWHFVRRRRLLALLTPRDAVSDSQVAGLFAELTAAAGLGRRARLTSSPACPVPMALTSSEVCVPARFLDDLDFEQQRGALAHEIAHLARRDPQWLTLDALIGALFFFQPMNVAARRALREAAESQCDDWAARQGAGLGLARCLATVASWLAPFPRTLLAVSIPMAAERTDLTRRVERLLADTAGAPPVARSRSFAAACLIVAAVAGASPAFSAAPADTLGTSALPPDHATAASLAIANVNREAEAQLQISRAMRLDDSLSERWAWALRDARARSRRSFWIGYSFDHLLRPTEQHLSDSDGIHLDELNWNGVKLGEMLGVRTDAEIAILVRYRGGATATPDRISHRSMNAPMDFGGDAVYWLGGAVDRESVPWLDALQQRMPTTALRSELVEALTMHRTSAIVLPVVERLLGSERDAHIRAEAAEGLEHHDVPAALELARVTATRDTDSMVRGEAAEAIGEMPVAGAVDVLVELANTSDDSHVRGEAAEALGSQPSADALRGIEAVIFKSPHEDARMEAVEALGELEAAEALPVLRRVIWEHPSTGTRVEAVETIGDLDGVDVVPELRDLLSRHEDPSVRHEVLDVLSGLETPDAYALLVDLATNAASAETRRDAIEGVAEASEKGRTGAEIEQAATLFERTIFNDHDESVQREAIDGLTHLPRQRALGILRKVVETHPSARLRREAVEAIAEMTRQ